jgi:hypothetical protein
MASINFISSSSNSGLSVVSLEIPSVKLSKEQLVDHNRQLVSEAHAIRGDGPRYSYRVFPTFIPANLSLQAPKKRKESTRKRAFTGAEVSEQQKAKMTRA